MQEKPGHTAGLPPPSLPISLKYRQYNDLCRPGIPFPIESPDHSILTVVPTSRPSSAPPKNDPEALAQRCLMARHTLLSLPLELPVYPQNSSALFPPNPSSHPLQPNNRHLLTSLDKPPTASRLSPLAGNSSPTRPQTKYNGALPPTHSPSIHLVPLSSHPASRGLEERVLCLFL